MISIFSELRRKQKAKREARRDAIPEATEAENAHLNIAARYSLTSRPRLWALLQAMQHVNRSHIEGDIVECGVWKGGNLILCGLVAKELELERKIWGFDTFAGMSMPTDVDVAVRGGRSIFGEWQKRQRVDGVNEWSYASYEDVEKNFRREVGTDNLVLVKGKVEDTLTEQKNLPDRIAVLRLDTDWYESTKIELEVLYPRLQSGGVLIIDDYGHWAGAKKAVDEYFRSSVWLHRIDYTGRLHIKA